MNEIMINNFEIVHNLTKIAEKAGLPLSVYLTELLQKHIAENPVEGSATESDIAELREKLSLLSDGLTEYIFNLELDYGVDVEIDIGESPYPTVGQANKLVKVYARV